MLKRWWSWLVFVAHTVLFSMVWLGVFAADAGPRLDSAQAPPPLTERVITAEDHNPHNTSAPLMCERDQLEESLDRDDADPLTVPQPASGGLCWLSPRATLLLLASSRGRAPPRTEHAHDLPFKTDRWLAVGLPTRGPPT